MKSQPDLRTTSPARGVLVEKPKSNAYTMLLLISLLALTIGCLCLYGEMSSYKFDYKAAGAR